MSKKAKSKAVTTVPDMLRLDQQLCFPLYAASNLLTRLYRPLLDELGLTYPQYLVMLVLWEHSMQSVTEIGTKLYLDSGTLTPLLKRMEKNGLVTRVRDAEDERRVVVTLTDNGRKLRKATHQVFEKLANESPIPLCDVDSLREGARNLIAKLAGHS